ncbi:hypothetical protein Cme02nite_34960 [Catellatospora methionotrophica]|uniref:Uncharacterized protein n=1 Tax=Catellatospora methionotrophica TaxID=121620 RepID=A0A8J3LB74_9ACTN|nr:hypothetical protein [Catellatospora methionotrophica]GIG15164.1 hypothetical protein Cme02nite_34960 [Catellatospora methionotrophica]
MPDQPTPTTPTAAKTIDKAKVLAALRDSGQDARAEFVDRQLPDLIDIDSNAGLLRTLGLDVAELNR